MHFKIKKRPNGWAVYKYDNDRECYVPKAAWPTGLSPDMTVEAARTIVKSLTAAAHENARAAHKLNIINRIRTDAEKTCAWLPEDVVMHFERVHIHSKSSRPGYQKLLSTWKLARRLIIDVNIDPSDWPDEPLPLHEWFITHPRGSDYVRRVLRLVNKYGRLYCRKRGVSFEPAELPSDAVMVEIEARFKKAKRSLPLLPEHLKMLKQKLSKEEMLWVEIAFHFGLRPEEVALAHAEIGTLVCDQPKLRKLKPERRIKRIPALTTEQKKVLYSISCKSPMRRPTRNTVQKHFPEGVTLYGCRHGFVRLMQSLKYSLPQISAWLGHRSLATTQKYYQDHGLLVEGKEAA